jgi:mono/diheme cytochrome c family protein
LLPADYIRASCGRCHKEGEVPGVPELTEGRRLFETHGCRGCHKLNGVGGSLGPDLSEEGTKERSPSWLERHFLNPREVSPTSAMPNFHFTHRQARALTYYMLSLTNEQMVSFYTSVELIPSVAAGRQLFIEKNCITCHAIGGVGGKAGPDLLGTTKQHSRGWLEEQLLNPEFVSPGSTMPAYHLNRNSQRALIMFLASATAADARQVLRGRPATLSKAAAGIETGKQAFIRFGCVGCHGQNATGGVPNPNSQGGEIPSLIHVADDYTRAEVEDIIRNGKAPPLADPKKPVPPLYMPVWKNTLNKEDINTIIDYLWSLRPKNESNW